jgi:hypothetical protein
MRGWASYLRARSDPPEATARPSEKRKKTLAAVRPHDLLLPARPRSSNMVDPRTKGACTGTPRSHTYATWRSGRRPSSLSLNSMHAPPWPRHRGVYVRACLFLVQLVLTPGNEMEGGHTIKTTVPFFSNSCAIYFFFCANARAIQNSQNSMDKILLPPSSPSGKKIKYVPV